MTPEQIRHLQRTSTTTPAASFEGDEELAVMYDAPPLVLEPVPGMVQTTTQNYMVMPPNWRRIRRLP